MAYMKCFTLKEKNIHVVVLLFLWEFVYRDVLFLSKQISWKGVSYCDKMLRLRCCRGSTSTLVGTNMGCMCKKSYSRAWQKIATGHCKFNVRPLHLIFKIQYHLTKTQPIDEVAYKFYITSIKK